MGEHSDSEPESVRFFSQFEKSGYYKNDAVHLNAGAPGTELLRMLPPIIEAATTHRMQSELEGDAQLFQYGEEKGNWQFRSFLAKFLSEEYGDPVNSEDIFLTGGASSGLWLLLSRLFPPGTPVFIEDPSYFVALKIFSEFGMSIIPVNADDDGIIIEDLNQKLISCFPDSPAPSSSLNLPLKALVYLIPVFNNPTGSVLPKDRCKKLIKLCRNYGATIVCDDVYNLLHYDDSPVCPRRLFMHDDKSHHDYVGNVISNASFSKILGPGLRIGWLEAPKWAVEKLQTFSVLLSGGGLNTFTSGIITSLIALGKMNTHLQKVKNIYKTHMEATAELLREELPPGCHLKSPAKGGYFLWIELPESISASNLRLFAIREYQVDFMPGQRASPSGKFANFIRICISFYPLDVLLSAVRRLCQAISDFQSRAEENPCFWQAYE
ncbi:2-aminoadipate transaminase-like [Uloborus diversus]|uniref:2-aminoadipate transaminase-like n=1 Tax=Uloborus diversus TaxID=327109 RepID=UPI00240935EA|nr:2-aminoadipate transaminase-like [Uloborus diversus]